MTASQEQTPNNAAVEARNDDQIISGSSSSSSSSSTSYEQFELAPEPDLAENDEDEENNLMEPLVPNGDTNEQSNIDISSSQVLVRVTAPANLREGFTFVAEVNGDNERTFTCTVPEGGVEEGTTFYTPLPPDFPGERIRAPFGTWKDGILDCFSLGLCHSQLWCSLCCVQLQMAQIMRRAQLNCFGRPESPVKTKNTFYIILMVIIFYSLFSTTLEMLEVRHIDTEGKTPIYLTVIKTTSSLFFSAWSVYSLCRARQSVRKQYNIPEQYCAGCFCEDFCCALLCTCCTAAQIARHTGEYETYPGVCCTETGHPPHTPVLV